LIPSVLLWIYQPGGKVSYAVFVTVLLLGLIFLWLFLISHYKTKDLTSTKISIIDCYDNKLCLCHPNPLLLLDSFVSFYLIINNYEKLIGYGRVIHIQDSKMVQIEPLVVDPITDISSFISTLQEQRKDIIIKTALTHDSLNVIFKSLETT